jgi:hypothetical protein
MTGSRAGTGAIAALLARGFNRHIRDYGPDGDYASEPVESGDGHSLVVTRGGTAYSVRVERLAAPGAPGRLTPGQALAALKAHLASLGPDRAETATYVVGISRQLGGSTTLHRDEEAARAALARYARYFWGETYTITGPPPDDDEEAIRIYFEHQPGEAYTITRAASPGTGERQAILALMSELEGS